LAVTNLSNRRHYVSSTSLSQILPGSPRAFVLNTAYKF
jgi:iron complex outermembrane receptor protein